VSIALRATLEPARAAVHWRGTWISYGQLHADIEHFAHRLLEHGAHPGDRVAILAANHPVHLHSLYAALRHGFVHAPLNHRLPPLETTTLLEYIEPRVLVYAPEFEAHAHHVRSRLPALTTIPLESVDGGVPRQPDVPSQNHERDWDATVMLLLTGGTTGVPKAARISRRMFEINLLDTITAWGLEASDATVMATPMFHAGVNALCTPLLAVGGRVALLERFSPEAFLESATAVRASILFAVPTMFQMLTTSSAFADADFSGVKYAIAGGSPCPEPVQAAFAARGVGFKLGYGMTEVGVNCFAQSLEGAKRQPGGVGFAMPHLRAVIRDEHGLEVAPGAVGELTFSGMQVMDGYWHKPLETAEALREIDGETWLFTGDLARLDADGCHFIVGRRKEMFISGGENVYPLEIERVLYEHPTVAECAVIGVPDERWGEVGLAVVVTRDGRLLEEQALQDFLRERLAGYKVPKHLQQLESLPKSAAGKVLKNELRECWLKGVEHAHAV
jgi:fatty-acyl-CoA synthase